MPLLGLLAVAFAAEAPWVVIAPGAVVMFGHAEVPLPGESGFSAQRTPMEGHDVWLHTEAEPMTDDPHCHPLVVTPNMELNVRVKVEDTEEVVTEAVRIDQSAEALLEVLPGSALGTPGLDGRTVIWAGDVKVSVDQSVATAREYQPGNRTWEVGDALRGEGPVSGLDEVWSVQGGWLAQQIQPGVVEMRTTCVHAIGQTADPVAASATWNAHLRVPVDPVEADVWVVPPGTALSWPDGTPAGTAIGEVLLPAETVFVRQHRHCGVFGLRHYADPDPDEAIEICFADSVGKAETRTSPLLSPQKQNDRSTALLRRFEMRHPGRQYITPGIEARCDVRGTVGKSGKLASTEITGCGEAYVEAAEKDLARWRWSRPVVNGKRVTFDVAFSVTFPTPD